MVKNHELSVIDKQIYTIVAIAVRNEVRSVTGNNVNIGSINNQ